MLAQWVSDKGEMHHAEWQLSMPGNIVVIHMQVETLGESGWDWNVWEQSGCVRQRYGLADTLNEAKVWAESAMSSLAWEYALAASASCARTRAEVPGPGSE